MLITTESELDSILLALKSAKYVVFDFETIPSSAYAKHKGASLHHKMLEIEGLSLRSESVNPVFIPFINTSISRLTLIEKLKELFSQESLFIAHNIQFDAKIADYFIGVRPKNKFCTLVGYWYIDENAKKDKVTLGSKLFGMETISYKEAKKQGEEVFLEYALRDAEFAWQLYNYEMEWFNAEEDRKILLDLASTLEMDFCDVLIDVTLRGISCDLEYLKQGEKILTDKALELEAQIYDKYGEFNLKSPMQLCEKIYGIKISRKDKKVTTTKLEGDYPKPTKFTKTGAPSTDDESLSKIDTDITRLIKEYRAVTKILDTYAVGFQKWIVDGRIYPSYNNSGTTTGRLCVHPDTLIEMPRDLKKYPNGVPLKDLHKGDIVYSFDVDRELCLRKVKWVGPTKVKKTIIIHTDKGLPLTVSEDHLVRKYNGDWCYAKNLKVGNRLLCMPKRGFDGGYSYFFPHSRNRRNGIKGGGKVKEHRFVALDGNPRSTNYLVHHKDENKLNNSPENLELIIGVANHKIKHSYKGRPELLKEAVRTGYGKTGHKLSASTIKKYKKRLQRNHIVTKVESGPEMLLWDLEIEDTHTFMGNDIALHNSSDSPNTQNIPGEPSYGWWLREAFRATEGYKLIVADESQLEIRLIAHLSADPYLIKAIKSGEDIHTSVGRMVLNKNDISPTERSYVKTLNFAVLYGLSTKALAENLGISWTKANKLKKRYFSTFPGVQEWIEKVRNKARKNGYLVTLIGRRRRLPDLLSSDDGIRGYAERQASNAQSQGGGSDILKVAMVNISRELKEKNLDAYILLQIHDELVLEAREEIAEEVAAIVKNHMEHPFNTELLVPLVVNPTICDKWSDGK